jgi:hypothetical protein
MYSYNPGYQIAMKMAFGVGLILSLATAVFLG